MVSFNVFRKRFRNKVVNDVTRMLVIDFEMYVILYRNSEDFSDTLSFKNGMFTQLLTFSIFVCNKILLLMSNSEDISDTLTLKTSYNVYTNGMLR